MILNGMEYALLLGPCWVFWLPNIRAKKKDLNYSTFTDLVLISLPIGLVGARLYYVLFSFSNYKNNLPDIFNVREGGLAIHGGIIFGLLTAFIFAQIKKISFLKIADVAAPSVILAQAM